MSHIAQDESAQHRRPVKIGKQRTCAATERYAALQSAERSLLETVAGCPEPARRECAYGRCTTAPGQLDSHKSAHRISCEMGAV
jgi:hypothetical protein